MDPEGDLGVHKEGTRKIFDNFWSNFILVFLVYNCPEQFLKNFEIILFFIDIFHLPGEPKVSSLGPPRAVFCSFFRKINTDIPKKLSNMNKFLASNLWYKRL